MQGRAEAPTAQASDGDPARITRRPLASVPMFAPTPAVETKTKDTGSARYPSFVSERRRRARPRKRYTITKVRESWTTQEHQRFLDAIKLYNRDWKKIEEFIGTKSVKQIRSHAQKYFLKVQKHGGTEFIPPARPKRKVSPGDGSSSTRRSPEQAQPSPPALVSNALSSQLHSNPSAMFSHWMSANGLAPPAGLLMPAPVFPHAPPSGPLHPLAPILTPNHDEIARLRRTQEQFAQAQLSLSNAMSAAAPSCPAPPGAPPQQPNYAKIYAFLGSLFDPATDNHVEALNLMSPVDRETVQIMMNNLAINLHNSILSMERGGDAHVANGGPPTLHPPPKEPLPSFRPDRPRLIEEPPVLAHPEGRGSLASHAAGHALPTFGNPARRDVADHGLDAPSLNPYLESPQQLRQEHGALYSGAGADYFK